MLIITKEGVQALKERMINPGGIEQSKEELKKMLGIGEAWLWRAEASASCCDGTCFLSRVSTQLAWEVKFLEQALEALEEGDRNKAATRLEEYTSQMD